MVTIRRAQLKRGSVGVDVTVKSAQGWARAFAPSWSMVMGHKDGKLSDEQYTTLYLAILRKAPLAAWYWLERQAVNGELTVLCYCRDFDASGQRVFCHTHLLIDYAVERFPDLFADGR